MLLSSEKVPSDPCAADTYLYVSQRSPLCMTQVLFKLLHLCWDSEGVDFCASPERGKSHFPMVLQLSWTSVTKSFTARCYGGSSSQCRTGAGEPNGELNPLTPQSWAEGVLHGCDIPPTPGSLPWGCGFWPDHISAPPPHLNEAPTFISFFFLQLSVFT